MKRRELLQNLLNACNHGKSSAQLHSLIVRTGLLHDSLFAAKLNSLYIKFASLETARKLFDEIPHRSVFLWNALLRGYCREKQWDETLRLFRLMLLDQKPDNFTIPCVIKACVGLRALKCGKMIHGLVKKDHKIGLDMFVGSALIDLYSKCGQMGEASKVFEQFAQPDIVLWTSMVTGHEQNGDPEKALSFFSRMVIMEHVDPDPVTLVSVVSACAQILNLKLGSCVHGFVIRRGFDTGISLANSLLNLYAKTGSVKFAASLFGTMQEKDVISWSSAIACHAQNKAPGKALDLFNEMINGKIEPNSVTMIVALQACAISSNIEEGKKIHELAIHKGLEFDISVSTSLIDMYMSCSSPDEANSLFKRLPKKDVVTWVSLLCGYALNGMAFESLRIFQNMLFDGIQPDAIAMVKILSACSEPGILQRALCLHGYVITNGFDVNNFVAASLIELYSKCGNLDDAIKIFKGTVERDVVIWTSMIAGYGIHGDGAEALKTFDQMLSDSSSRPNEVTFLSLLSACSHAGLVEEGIEIFNRMVHDYRLNPGSEHYGIVVDLLGRTGKLEKAIDVINQMPVPAGPHVWGALLGACRIHQNTNLGEIAARNLFQLDSEHAGYYILLCSIYAMDGKWDSAAKLRAQIKKKGMKKMFAKSEIEVSGKIHSFLVDDGFNQETQQIYGLLTNLELRMREEGYIREADFVRNDVEVVL